MLADDAFSEAGILETESHQLRTTARSELTDSEVTLDETGLVEAADTHLVAGSRALRRANPRWDGLSEILAKIEALRAQAEKLRHSTA